jgi:diguanylate cyclase (GGDEF)-like protein
LLSDSSERQQAEQSLRRNAELAALNQMGQALSRLAEPAELLELIYTLVGQVLDNQNLYIALYDEAQQLISFPVYSIAGQRVSRPARRLGTGLTEYVIRTRALLWLPRDLASAAIARGIEPQGRPARCFVAVPLLVGEQVLGVLALQDYEREQVYDQGQVDVLTTIAAQAAIALENAHLFAETRQRAEHLQAINDVERMLGTTLEPPSLCAHIARVLHSRLALGHVTIGLIEGDQLVVQAASDAEGGVHRPDLRFQLGPEGLTGPAAASGQSLVVPDVRLEPSFQSSCFWPNTHSEVAVPLKTPAGLIGVLNMESDQVNAFAPELVRLVETLASRIAIGIENARLFTEARSRADDFALLYETTRDLATHYELAQLLPAVVERATRLLSAPSGAVYLCDNGQRRLTLACTTGPLPYLAELRWGEGVSGQVAQTGELLIIDDYARWAYRSFQIEGAAWCTAVLGVPLHYMGELKGVLVIGETSPTRTFSQDEAHLISLFASQVAGALPQTDLFTRVQQLARIDDLTGLYNRRYLFELGEQELRRARRFGHPLSLLMLDIDDFKQINDRYGHESGDQVLRTVANCCLAYSRDSDKVGRYGGEELVILLVETELASARLFAERLCRRVAQTATPTAHGPVHVTVSLGVAAIQAEGDGWAALLGRADRALYAAKQAGRNRVAVA